MRKSASNGVLRPVVAALTAVAFVFSPMAVLAQQPKGPTPKLFMLPTQGVRDQVSSIIPERIGEMMRSQLKDQRSVELLPTYDKLQEQGGGRANAALGEAQRLYTAGIGLLTAGQNKKASKSFQKAVDIMEQNIADLQNFDMLADAYKNMALAYFNAGFDFDGRKRMKVFACLRPNTKLDKEKFPKELRKVFAHEAHKVTKGGPGKLEVKTKGGAQGLVYVDGVSKGKTPATITDVGYGYHYLVVRSPNGSVWSDQIRVRGRGRRQTFKVELGGGAKAAGDAKGDDSNQPAFYSGLLSSIKSGKFASKELQPNLSELNTRTGADFVAWIAMAKKGSGYAAVPFVYRASDGLMVQGEPVEFNIELSNLRVGVSQLTRTIVSLVGTMPEDKAVASVELGAPKKKPAPTHTEQASATKQASATHETAGSATKQAEVVASNEHHDQAKSDTDKKKSVEPIEPPSKKESNNDKWWLIGGGAAAVLVTGLVIGGAVYASDSGPTQAKNFDAQLSW